MTTTPKETMKATREYQEIFNYYVDSGVSLKEAEKFALADMREALA